MELTVIAAMACIISSGVIYIILQSTQREKVMLDSKSPVNRQGKKR